jgi:hypothetical protein
MSENSPLVIGGWTYTHVRGSDLNRDGMFLELSEMKGTESRLVMEVFYSDKTDEMAVTAFREAVPLAAVEWIISQAKILLPPIEKETAKS